MTHAQVTISKEFNEEMEEIRAVIPQYEDDIVQEPNQTCSKGIIPENLLIHKQLAHNTSMSESELYKVPELLDEVEEKAKKNCTAPRFDLHPCFLLTDKKTFPTNIYLSIYLVYVRIE